jgi:hypothetical protein
VRQIVLVFAIIFLVGGCNGADGNGDSGLPDGLDGDGGKDGGDEIADEDNRPQSICNPGTSGFTGSPFVDVTEEAGLSESGIDATGFRLTGADLDGDGYVDLVAIGSGGNDRGLQRVYMNIPHPTQAGKRAFAEVTDTGIDLNRAAGVQGRSTSLHVAGDVDNDGDLDLFAGTYVSEKTDWDDRQEILLNDGNGHFTLVEGESTVATEDPPSNSAAIFFDYDRDGNLDLYVGNWYVHYGVSLNSGQDELYRGAGDGTFTLVTDQAGLTQQADYGEHDDCKPTYGLSHCDIEGDGNQDILQAAYGRQWNDLWLNFGNGTFINIGMSSGFDADDLTDFTDNEFYRCYCRDNPTVCTPDQPPVVDCSIRGWSIYDEMPFRLNGNTFGAECADYDNDGDMDIFTVEITHGWAGSSSDRSQILINNGESGANLTFSRPGLEATGINRRRQGVAWEEGDVYAGWIDYDNDGLLDLVINSAPYPGDSMHLYHQKPDHTFYPATLEAGINLHNPHALVLADYDLDGDVDIITSVAPGSYTGWPKAHVFLFENNMGNLSNWSRIQLLGKGPPDGANASAIGARVTVTSADLVQVREVKGGSGQFGRQDELALTFGFGERCDDLTIEVRWPNQEGTVQRFEGVRANYPILISEGEDQVTYLHEE